MSLPRVPGERITPSRRRQYAAALRELWTSEPDLTIAQARERTGAPYDFTQRMRVRCVREGILKGHQHARRKVAL